MSQPHRLPVITLALILTSIVAAFWVVLQPDALAMLGFTPNQPQALGFVANIFVHANLVHLLGNMVFLAAVGPAAEWSLSPWRYTLVYLVGGYMGTGLHWALAQGADSGLVLVGASGSISACVAFYAVRYFTLRVPIAPKVSVPLWIVILAWLILQISGVFVQFGQASATSYWAHLGGFATGLLFSAMFRAPKQASLVFGHEVLDQMNLRGPAAVITAAEAHLKHHPEDIGTWIRLAEAHRMLGHDADESTALTVIVDRGLPQEQANAIERLAELDQIKDWPVYKRARLADSIQAQSQSAAIRLLESIVGEKDPSNEKAEALFSLSQLTAESNPSASESYAKRLLAEYALHDACARARARGLLR